MLKYYPLDNPNFSIARKVFSNKECDRICKYMSFFDTTNSLIGNSNDSREDENVRKSQISFHNYKNDATDWIFHRLGKIVTEHNTVLWNFDIDRLFYFQFSEYDHNKSHYDWHVDISEPDKNGTRKLSIAVLLNDGFEGGNFHVNYQQKNAPLNLNKGDAVLFPSYMPHKVDPVISNTRKSLVSWVLGPAFK